MILAPVAGPVPRVVLASRSCEAKLSQLPTPFRPDSVVTVGGSWEPTRDPRRSAR
ncbi:hypothetical protein GCM10023322_71170 [Rugosimonospora acidiphila]|uniref:Uncharacterized protein n=1 Tax=Rugosimonospora acidiphila TaxID=556531 RepID=A0ABP9SN78_9ACTN